MSVVSHLKDKVTARNDFVEEKDDAPQHDKDHHNGMGFDCIDHGGRLLDQAQAQLQHAWLISILINSKNAQEPPNSKKISQNRPSVERGRT